ncbi:MAG: cytidylate kinase-like family protein [Clostridia bacterium]|nr:cytidylate kinase-like family protein [Clostridia bacterium]
MKKLITISREYGSGGRIIGKLLAEKLNVPFYDREIIDLSVEESGFSKEVIEGAELKAKSGFAYNLSTALNFNEGFGGALSVNDKLFLAQFEVIRKIGEAGEGVMVGRCADYVLRELPGVTNVFIHAELEDRIKRAVEKYGENPDKVAQKVKDYDKARKNYYDYHTGLKWGEYSNYNLSLNTSYITEEMACELIATYIESRTYK